MGGSGCLRFCVPVYVCMLVCSIVDALWPGRPHIQMRPEGIGAGKRWRLPHSGWQNREAVARSGWQKREAGASW